MLRNLLFVLIGGCVLASPAAADDVGYVDCQTHPESTAVLAKAAKTSEVVTSLPCGERFTILLSGDFFSKIQTRDGKVGYVNSYLISRDYDAASMQPVAQPTAQPMLPQSAPPEPAKVPTAASPSPPHEIPYVFIQGTGNTTTQGTAVGGNHWLYGTATTDQRDQTIELAQDFSTECRGVKLTLNQQDADYAVSLNHQAFHGLVHKNDQIMVTNRSAEVLTAVSTHSVTGAVKDACNVILADFAAKK